MKLKNIKLNGTTSNVVTDLEEKGRAVARKAACEGMVLLKNEDQLLPLSGVSSIGLYGAGAEKTIKGGTGSGDVNERHSVTIREGLVNAGFTLTSEAWLDSYSRLYDQARIEWRSTILKEVAQGQHFFNAYSQHPFFNPDGDMIDVEKAKTDGADIAIFVLARICGENKDRFLTGGDYYISEGEKKILADVCAAYKKVILVINSGALVDLNFADEFENIGAILQFVQAGEEGGNALADILLGKVTPSAKLTDTWPNHYEDYPDALKFSYLSGDVIEERYREGIYVGYRYFDSFDVPVRYCFGYGLSYTDFSMEALSVETSGLGMANPKLKVSVKVTNTGSTYSGKEVVQIYASCPQGRLNKEYRRLAAFAKTKLLAPGESEILSVSFPFYQLASYDEAKSAYLLEPGFYGLWMGNSLDSAKPAWGFTLDKEAVLVRCQTICPLKEELEEIKPDADRIAEKEAALKKALEGSQILTIQAEDLPCEVVAYNPRPEKLEGVSGEIVDRMTEEQLILMATGDPSAGQGAALGSAAMTVPGAAAETQTCAREDLGVPSIVLADGPAGIRLHQTYHVQDGKIRANSMAQAFEHGFFAEGEAEPEGDVYYQYCTAIPVGAMLAQTWDVDLIQEVGEMIGQEMEEFQVTLWLAPGMNIHRNPLCGRNFEYYSEDPLVSGMIAGAMTLGVQKMAGCGTTIKHFACNNQEDNRMGCDSILSERALREIYLKGFEIAIKDTQPMSIMTSYNMINGVHAANCYDICTKAARDEWGFAGAIMTDWTTTTGSTRGECSAAGCMKAGNDMVMPGSYADHDSIREALKDGSLKLHELKHCVYKTVKVCLASNKMEDAISYTELFDDLGSWMEVER